MSKVRAFLERVYPEVKSGQWEIRYVLPAVVGGSKVLEFRSKNTGTVRDKEIHTYNQSLINLLCQTKPAFNFDAAAIFSEVEEMIKNNNTDKRSSCVEEITGSLGGTIIRIDWNRKNKLTLANSKHAINEVLAELKAYEHRHQKAVEENRNIREIEHRNNLSKRHTIHKTNSLLLLNRKDKEFFQNEKPTDFVSSQQKLNTSFARLSFSSVSQHPSTMFSPSMTREQWIAQSGFPDDIRRIQEESERIRKEWYDGPKKANKIDTALNVAIDAGRFNRASFANIHDFIHFSGKVNDEFVESIRMTLDAPRMPYSCITPSSRGLLKH